MAAANWGRYGKQRPAWQGGSDDGCFASALARVYIFGGVIEHPATSHAWAYYLGEDGPRVSNRRWREFGHGLWCCVVAQSAYGHKCEKLTGLLYAGSRPPFELRWERPEGTHQIGYQDQRGKARNKPTCPKRETSATPQAFASELISLAEWSRP